MDQIIKSLFLGIIQGLLEWLPISSQGNLVILMSSALGFTVSEALNMSVFLHVGTGLAAVVYFRKDIPGIIFRDSQENEGLFKFLFITTALTGVIGLPLFIFAKEMSNYGELLLAITGLALIATGIIQRRTRDVGDQSHDSLDPSDGLLLGVAQGFAAIPGISRSGITTSILLFKKNSGEAAFRLSFLMSIPAVFAATVGLAIIEGVPQVDANMIVAIAASFLSALISIDFLIKTARRIKFWGLCIALGLLALLPQFVNFLV